MFFYSKKLTLYFKVLFDKMKNKNKHLEDLTEIRSIMERASRFISLSGLSGIIIGSAAIIGSLVTYWYVYIYLQETDKNIFFDTLSRSTESILLISMNTFIIFIIAISSSIFFTTKMSKKKGLPIWDNTAKKMIENLSIPLITGGFFILILLFRNEIKYIVSLMLLFYGLALLHASKYTLSDIKYLGYIQILLGLLSAIWYPYGLLFWAIGFGVMHIIYGLLMYNKYERPTKEK